MSQMRQAGQLMPTSLRGIANKASSDEHHRFRNLFGLLTVAFLLSCWERVNKKAASGVDRVKARSYAKDLVDNVRGLWDRVKRCSYRAKLVRRCRIPKEGGKTRPLGVPVVEDKLLQIAVSRILNAIYEPMFLPCSWAYRLGRNAREAVRTLTQELQFGCYGYVVEVDIKGFFDRIDHDKLLQMLELRIDDRPFLRLIWKWLKAGVLEEGGKVIHPDTGCPQGSGISPVLANIYLHYVLDLWFTDVVKPRCKARAFICRYADDVVFAFQWFEDAERFFRVLPKRLAKYGLELSAEKSRMVRFSRFQLGKSSERFDFLGFEFRWVVDHKGAPRVTRRTSRKRLRVSLARVTEWIKAERHLPVRQLVEALNARLRGHYNYYGVIGNHRSLWALFYQVTQLLKKWLGRRSQKSRMTWEKFSALLKRFPLEEPRITESRHRQMVLAGVC
ncbi:MAG TPA: group II intron reverse transcriptase/maturase [Thermoanaerobaculia bacterium]